MFIEVEKVLHSQGASVSSPVQVLDSTSQSFVLGRGPGIKVPARLGMALLLYLRRDFGTTSGGELHHRISLVKRPRGCRV